MADDSETQTICELKECGCGRLTLRVGRVRLDLTRAELTALHELLAVATGQPVAADPRTVPTLH